MGDASSSPSQTVRKRKVWAYTHTGRPPMSHRVISTTGGREPQGETSRGSRRCPPGRPGLEGEDPQNVRDVGRSPQSADPRLGYLGTLEAPAALAHHQHAPGARRISPPARESALLFGESSDGDQLREVTACGNRGQVRRRDPSRTDQGSLRSRSPEWGAEPEQQPLA